MIGGGVASIAVIIFAILDSQPKPLAELDSRQTIETGQWRIQTLALYVTNEPPRGASLRNGNPAIVLEARLTNRTSETSSDYQTLFKPQLDLDPRDARPIVVLARDTVDNRAPALHPALGDTVAFVWSYPNPRKGTLKITVNSKTYKAVDNLKGLPGWFDEKPIGFLASTGFAAQRAISK